jgi:hypothetical protein
MGLTRKKDVAWKRVKARTIGASLDAADHCVYNSTQQVIQQPILPRTYHGLRSSIHTPSGTCFFLARGTAELSSQLCCYTLLSRHTAHSPSRR